MPKRCVAAGCDKEAMDSSACSHFLRIPSEEPSDEGRWPKQDPTGLDQAVIRFYAAYTSQKIASKQALLLLQSWDYLPNEET